MKMYFAGAIHGGRGKVETYKQLIEHCKKYGTVFTEHVGDNALMTDGEQNLSDKQIHDRDIDWVSQSDVLIAEVSTASLGVGYEIRYAIERGKHILCLFDASDGGKTSSMIAGAEGCEKKGYASIDEAKNHISEFLDKIADKNL